MIPRKLHFIWIGDESKRPDNCINTWKRKHDTQWEIKIWGNEDLARPQGWINGEHMRDMGRRELCGVADMMRYEILYEQGGIALDADAICLRPLEESMLRWETFSCWESEIARPGLIGNCAVGSEPGTAFMRHLIEDILAEYPQQRHLRAWESTGPQRFSDTYRKYAYHGLHIYPSHFFLPGHYSGLRYDGRGAVFADQLWGSTSDGYDELHKREVPV